MKIWIDITNSPHVLFFQPFIEKIKAENNQIVITALDNSHVISLLHEFNLPHKVIGKHLGKNLFSKAKGFYSRTNELYNFIKNENIDVSVCHQSPYSMFSSKKAQIKTRIYIFDNDKAKLQNFLGLRYSTRSICPEIVQHENSTNYQGIKESIYLWNFKPSKKVCDDIPFSSNDYIVFRPEPWKAQYYKGNSNYSFELIRNLTISQNVVLIPRDNEQKNQYLKLQNSRLFIPENILDSKSLIFFSKLMIGGGGTMNRESVILGTPVISTYQGGLLKVDKWLIGEGYMAHNVAPSLKFCLDWINQSQPNNLKESGYSSFKNLLDIFLSKK